jgi:uncharacterized CHY-type Zn-finger protein
MRSAYSYWTCFLCKKTMRGHGFAKYNHQMKHVREGRMIKKVVHSDTSPYRQVVFDIVK